MCVWDSHISNHDLSLFFELMTENFHMLKDEKVLEIILHFSDHWLHSEIQEK